MTITLICTCGRRQSVPEARAGQRVSCAGCGKELSVPAMGVLAGRTKARPTEVPPSSSRRLGVGLIGAGVLLLSVCALFTWWPGRAHTPQEQLVETREPEKKAAAPPPERPALLEPAPTPKEAPAEPADPSTPTVEPVGKPAAKVRLIQEAPTSLPKVVEPPIEVKKAPASKSLNLMEPLKLVWKLKEGETFYQEVIVTQKPTYQIQGLPVAALLQYRVISSLTVQKAAADGSLTVQQKVVSSKLLQADPLTQTALAGAVAQLPGTTFTLHLSPKMDVVKFEGGPPPPVGAAFAAGGAQGMQTASLLDADGWKELAQATFFQMDGPLKLNDRWAKPMTHHWGSLGSWAGQIHYAYTGQQGAVHRIAYGLQLGYRPPPAGAVVGGMKVLGANFQAQQGGGFLFFDADRGKVVSAEERFLVRGAINTNLLGQNLAVAIVEDQHFLLRIHDKMIP